MKKPHRADFDVHATRVRYADHQGQQLWQHETRREPYRNHQREQHYRRAGHYAR
eukprot:CAMPEP_0197126460 /NCGR_PEP_ID=MMETSP1390-20130617/10613_1 /TAXON_ID=38833 /ORGANISM="Micromonas sp., Strain CCMP2099" /LENGTH=53 /DNA_ID=CAMNT_0042568685 /DNA_START=167 /DNA_END=324 /DNA_ORIENTATION=-